MPATTRATTMRTTAASTGCWRRGGGSPSPFPSSTWRQVRKLRGAHPAARTHRIRMQVARRCGFPMVGLNLPSHFMIRPATDEVAFLVDPYHRGEVLFLEARAVGRWCLWRPAARRVAPASAGCRGADLAAVGRHPGQARPQLAAALLGHRAARLPGPDVHQPQAELPDVQGRGARAGHGTHAARHAAHQHLGAPGRGPLPLLPRALPGETLI